MINPIIIESNYKHATEYVNKKSLGKDLEDLFKAYFEIGFHMGYRQHFAESPEGEALLFPKESDET